MINLQRYIYGAWAYFLRKITKNRIKIISAGSIPRCYIDWMGIVIEKKKITYNKRDSGVKGKVIITGIPQRIDSKNTVEMRKLWVGCKIKGFLWSPYKFMAIDMQECWRALRKNNPDNTKDVENLIIFWEEKICSITDTFLFEDCFSFERNEFYVSEGFSFGGSLCGKIIQLR
jgi:hypothetical protein